MSSAESLGVFEKEGWRYELYEELDGLRRWMGWSLDIRSGGRGRLEEKGFVGVGECFCGRMMMVEMVSRFAVSEYRCPKAYRH